MVGYKGQRSGYHADIQAKEQASHRRGDGNKPVHPPSITLRPRR
ncbi:Uncharacterised protein [Klebsiella pneumoniae]|nr:Uncharacterised protein [Klebsiella pneumoniae]